MNEPASPEPRLLRRTTLKGALALPAFLCARRLVSRGPATVADFLEDWAQRAAALAAEEAPNEDGHLFELCAALTRVDPTAFPRRTRDAYRGDGMTTGPLRAEATFLALEIELEPGAVIRAHNHVGWNFVSLGVEGEALVRHFEPLERDHPDPGKDLGVEFPLREVASGLLTRGRTSSLSRTRANIHQFVAGERGARMIDFGVHFPDPGAGPKAFSVLELADRPEDEARRVWRGRWIGNVYAKK